MEAVCIVDGTDAHIDDAARIWAAATAARDGDVDVPPLELARPIIQNVLSNSRRSRLIVAVTCDGGQTVGFAAVEPSGPSGPAADVAEVRYVGVHPQGWGTGIGAELMRALPERLAAIGYARAQLMVYVENRRAVQLYERLGWQADGRPTPHPRSGKLEQRYVLDL
jgi:ribosomal protein S18 acetylase RimI-like enzyme